MWRGSIPLTSLMARKFDRTNSVGCVRGSGRFLPRAWHVYEGAITLKKGKKCLHCDTLITLGDGKLQYHPSEKLMTAQLRAELGGDS